LRCAALWAICSAAIAAAQLRIASIEPAILRDGAGAARLILVNDGKAPLTLKLSDLSAGSLVDDTSHEFLTAPTVTFKAETGSEDRPVKLGPGQPLRVVANVSGLKRSAAANATLFHLGVALGTLTAVASDVSLNLTLDGEDAGGKKLAYVFGRSAFVTLKNGGKEYLTLDWRFRIDGAQEQTGTVTLAPGGANRIELKPTADVYSWKDFVFPSTRTGILLLAPRLPAGVSTGLLPSLALPVSLRMMRTSPDTTFAMSGLFVALLLFIGGMVSVLVNSILPNRLRKIELRGQIESLHDRISSLSLRVDSYLRVLLRVERKKLEVQLDQIGSIAAAPAEFQAIDASRTLLENRLAAAERLDELKRRFEDVSASAPPSIMDKIDRTLQSAADRLHSYALPEKNVADAIGLMEDAEKLLGQLKDDKALAQQIADAFKIAKTRQSSFHIQNAHHRQGQTLDPIIEEMVKNLPGIFEILDKQFDDPNNIVPPMFFAIDYSVAAVKTAQDYAMVKRSAPAMGAGKRATHGKSARTRLEEHEPDLIDLLGTLSWQSLRAARNLVQQMREDIYQEDVIQEIAKQRTSLQANQWDKVARVDSDIKRTRPYLPVNFTLSFDDPRFVGAAALDVMLFHWKFPGDMEEEGLKVCHYFLLHEPGSAPKPLPARLWNCVKRRISSIARWFSSWWCEDALMCWESENIPIELTVQSKIDLAISVRLPGEIEVQPSEMRIFSRPMIEVLRFLLTFLVALAGLEMGALDQLNKLDFLPATIAIVALGFGADSIKNVLTQTPKKAG
jgi:hypothetical protein